MLSGPVSSWRIVTSAAPQRVGPDPVLFCLLFNDLDEGADSSSARLMMTKNGGVVDPQQECTDLQSRI